MNCPNCGAENDAEARFCAECGTPLDDVVVETAKVEQVFDDTSEDMTILSTPSEAAAEAKTLAVDQAKVVAGVEEGDEKDDAETGGDDDLPSEPEASPPPSTPLPSAGGGDQNSGGMDLGAGGDSDSGSSNRTLIIVGVIILVLLLLCCCCSVLIGAAIGSDPNTFENLMREFSWLPVNLAFV